MMTEKYSIEIPDATAHHSNQVQVRTRDDVNPESQWSEWSPLSFHTPWQGGTLNPQGRFFFSFTLMDISWIFLVSN